MYSPWKNRLFIALFSAVAVATTASAKPPPPPPQASQALDLCREPTLAFPYE
jgi:hypothetical protein